jgi:AraC-like DNA-binding protein
MKVLPFKILMTKDQTVLFEDYNDMILYGSLHQHEEVQISYIEQGSGNLLVGDVFTPFAKGDVFVFGKNLPHVFKSDQKCTMKTIYFTKECFGKNFFSHPDLEEISLLFNVSEKGIKVTSNLELIQSLMLEYREASRIKRFHLFIDLLDQINKSEKKQLSTFLYNKEMSLEDGKRMGLVFDYLMKNIENEVSLQEVADVASLSKNAFCRYFKQRTNKTFFEFLIEIRIEKACGLLIKYPDLSITEIAELCGFKNISNFNRKFKEIKEVSPKMIKKGKILA